MCRDGINRDDLWTIRDDLNSVAIQVINSADKTRSKKLPAKSQMGLFEFSARQSSSVFFIAALAALTAFRIAPDPNRA